MKVTKAYILFVFLVILSSCQEVEEEKIVPLSVNKVLGSWQLKSTYISPGGATTWQEVTDGDILSFAIDRTFTQTNTFEDNFDKSGTFELNDGILTWTYQENSDEKTQSFSVEMAKNTMTLSPAGPIFCVEACLSRYERID